MPAQAIIAGASLAVVAPIFFCCAGRKCAHLATAELAVVAPMEAIIAEAG